LPKKKDGRNRLAYAVSIEIRADLEEPSKGSGNAVSRGPVPLEASGRNKGGRIATRVCSKVGEPRAGRELSS